MGRSIIQLTNIHKPLDSLDIGVPLGSGLQSGSSTPGGCQQLADHCGGELPKDGQRRWASPLDLGLGWIIAKWRIQWDFTRKNGRFNGDLWNSDVISKILGGYLTELSCMK